jgi:molecular chaperone DnaK (HSP70)
MTLRGIQRLNETTVTNVTAKSFGLEVLNQADKDVVQNLVKVDDTLPVKTTRQFSTHADQQSGVLLKIMENSHRVIDDGEVPIDECKEIGRAELSFERALPRHSPIEVTFTLLNDGTLKVHGRDLTTQKMVDAEFKSDALLSKDDMEKSRKKIKSVQVT